MIPNSQTSSSPQKLMYALVQMPEYQSVEEYLEYNPDIGSFLNNFNLLDTVEKFNQLLEDDECLQENLKVIIPWFQVVVLDEIRKIKDLDQRIAVECIIAEVASKAISDQIQSNPDDKMSILQCVYSASTQTKKLFQQDYNAFQKIIRIYQLTINHVKKEEPKMVWSGKGKLEELVDQLYQSGLIKSKSACFNLFRPQNGKEVKVKWDFERKEHLAYLLYELYQQEFIKMVRTKGYFVYAEKHFVSFDGLVFKKNTLKKISSSIRQNPQGYSNVIREIRNIIKSIN